MKDILMRLTWVDYIVALGVLRGFYIGYKGGIFPEVLRIASYIVTALLAFYFYEPLGQHITVTSFFNHSTASALAFVLLLLAGFLVTKVLRILLLKTLKVGQGGLVMRLVGLVFGGLRWLLLLSFIFMLIDYSPLAQLKKDIHTRSVVGKWVSQAGPVIFEYLSHLSPQLGLPDKK